MAEKKGKHSFSYITFIKLKSIAENDTKISKVILELDNFLKKTNDHLSFIYYCNILLTYACNSNHDNPEPFKALLLKGATANAVDEYGKSALMNAAQGGRIKIVKFLLDNGADCNYVGPRSQSFSTALFLAAKFDHLDTCFLLISHGANLMLIYSFGESILDRYGSGELISLTHSEKNKRRAILRKAFSNGPHPNACWGRRWPFMSVMTGCDFHPLISRKTALLLLNPPVPHDAEIPPIIISTHQQYISYLNGSIFGNSGLVRLIVRYL